VQPEKTSVSLSKDHITVDVYQDLRMVGIILDNTYMQVTVTLQWYSDYHAHPSLEKCILRNHTLDTLNLQQMNSFLFVTTQMNSDSSIRQTKGLHVRCLKCSWKTTAVVRYYMLRRLLKTAPSNLLQGWRS
jgi:hypothetical protein